MNAGDPLPGNMGQIMPPWNALSLPVMGVWREFCRRETPYRSQAATGVPRPFGSWAPIGLPRHLPSSSPQTSRVLP